MNEFEKVKKMLEQEEVTFSAVTKNGLITSSLRGIAPMMNLLQEDEASLSDACVADRVIGRAAAFLLLKGRAAKLYAKVISRHALDILEKSQIEVVYDKCVPYIVNRKGDGMCPMEECVLNTEDADEAYRLLSEKLESLRRQ